MKFLFTSEKLSVQLHPGGPSGKTEMWHVLRAQNGAQIAVGFREAITRERLRETAITGEIEHLLRWIPVKAGDTYFIPARTVHAIGPGVTLCEIQQNSDVTYRLYDYNRLPLRELHLDEAARIADLGSHPGASTPVRISDQHELLTRCEFFATESISIHEELEFVPDAGQVELLIFIEGRGTIAGSRFGLGEVWLVPPDAGPFNLRPDGSVKLLRTYVPREAT